MAHDTGHTHASLFLAQYISQNPDLIQDRDQVVTVSTILILDIMSSSFYCFKG